ncbi:uncharacterized protein CIMG_03002 [Coccidioides immitis RS]|uniref:Uncharacterized protein n=4 Tax=Coccidioides immitis TaxID=5501 RepID=J3KAE0_COCIM|nr:uncharacterized protein CIMG_03002 [Coccidioides immitis RS]EAS31978.3 hypothetical protein CIMG_03002 [Coccidioides immitis RS]KMP07164.1 hypothetical protein CIRG_06844 [Coccidioides immitis RMSCC 2394]KMU72596.1 hypothetical protein CISG_09787 [Coccidioides immitis RMSCC 3703]KMU82235.1 hypothetical protein CIHG_00021 [Coccidioides immitis H538.4]
MSCGEVSVRRPQSKNSRSFFAFSFHAWWPRGEQGFSKLVTLDAKERCGDEPSLRRLSQTPSTGAEAEMKGNHVQDGGKKGESSSAFERSSGRGFIHTRPAMVLQDLSLEVWTPRGILGLRSKFP